MPKQPDMGMVSGMQDFAGVLIRWLGERRGGGGEEVVGHPWKVVPGGFKGYRGGAERIEERRGGMEEVCV